LIKKPIFLFIILAAELIAVLTYQKYFSFKQQEELAFGPEGRSSVAMDILRKTRSVSITTSDYFSLNEGKVSRYDDLIMKFSATVDWDWRLLASLICQESEFKADVVSRSGAYGLMQIMPITGRNFGIDITASPENNIRAGIQYINWLNSIFESRIADRQERLNFVLAAYNAGPGHVLDAMRLAEKNGMDPQKWDGSVAVWLLKKSEPQYYKDSVVKNGYFRGKESVKFVTEVLGRFEHYKNTIPEQKSHPYGE
jgi:membrane-bound lytic murein transglycosylase F